MHSPLEPAFRFYPACLRWTKQAQAEPIGEYLGDLLRIRTVVRGPHTPASIFHFFHTAVPDDPIETQTKLAWIRQQTFRDLLDLTGAEYRLDWSREDDSFCLWYRHRDERRDVTRDLSFMQRHTVPLFPGAQIQDSTIHGFGLFSLRSYPAGTLLGKPLQGQELTVDQYDQLRVQMAGSLGRLRQFFFLEWNALSEELLLVRPFRTYYSFLNHSVSPNLELVRDFQGQLCLRTRQALSVQEELTLDYRKEPLPLGYFDSFSTNYLRPPVWHGELADA